MEYVLSALLTINMFITVVNVYILARYFRGY